jgi:hypothetical protein
MLQAPGSLGRARGQSVKLAEGQGGVRLTGGDQLPGVDGGLPDTDQWKRGSAGGSSGWSAEEAEREARNSCG